MTTLNWVSEKILRAKQTGSTSLNLNYTLVENTRSDLSPLTHLPVQLLKELPFLEKLDVSGNEIEIIPDEIGDLSSLTSLNFSYNKIKWLPESIISLKSLEYLDLNSNDFEEFPDIIFQLKNLSQLNLTNLYSWNLLKFPDTLISESLGQLKKLTHISFGKLNLKALPETIGDLRNLKWINGVNNLLTELPHSVARLSNLEYINLASNKIKKFPEELLYAKNLRQILLSDNQIKNLPDGLQNLTKLARFDVSGNPIPQIEIPKFVIDINSKWKVVTEAKTKTPLWVKREIEKAKDLKLKVLDLSYSPLKYSVKTDPLKQVPVELLELENLEVLNLANNDLSEMPNEIERLKNLRELNLHNNKFSIFPNSLYGLSELTVLDISKNNISTLPEEINEMKKMKVLDFSSTQIRRLPRSIAKMHSLESLICRGDTNPASGTGPLRGERCFLETPPPEIFSKGINSIREYFIQLEQQGKDNLYEAKLIILGEGGAGKTTLSKKILSPSYELQDEITTEGIDVIQWKFQHLPHTDYLSTSTPVFEKLPSWVEAQHHIENISRKGELERVFSVNLWDFGGQEIYHATHQFFLTKRSLYILVADTRKDDTDFYYWLNIVELLSDNSPLLIIKNEKQDRHREINERQLRSQFGNLKAILSANLATNRGLTEVIREIKHYITALPHIGNELPRTWVSVREKLEKDSRNFIGVEEYLALCKENGFTTRENSLQLSGYLHDLGVFLHFQDDPLLSKTIILKPKWGTDAVYKVLDNKNVIRNLGEFSRSDLEVIWNLAEYSNMHNELLQLMMKFRLCYQIPDDRNSFIAPQLLTENQAQYPWQNQGNLLLRYTYEFMPKGILTQLIVALHNFIVKYKNSSLVWRSGIVVTKDKTAAEVIEYYGKREIHVRVAGMHSKELLTIVMYELDKIHASYKRLKYDKLIPCNCDECAHEKEPYFYHFDRLKKFIEDKQALIQCQQSYKMVSVYGLIENVFDAGNQSVTQRLEGGDPAYQIKIEQGATVGNIILANSIENSFNKLETSNLSEDLKITLKDLVKAVDAMNMFLAEEQKNETTKDLTTLIDEATKKSPRKEWYSLSVDGLITAAEKVGRLGKPVVELAAKIITLLNVT